MYRRLVSASLLLGSIALSGCISKMAANGMANALSGEGAGAFTRDNDLAFVGDAIPFAIKLMESVRDAAPKHAGIRQALCSAYTQYAMVYVAWPAEKAKSTDYQAYTQGEARARNFLERANGQCFQALEREIKGFGELYAADPNAALAQAKAEHVGLLYWTGASWLARITKSKEDVFAIGELPQAAQFIHRALALDPSWGQGTLHDLSILLEPSMPQPGGAQRAREHYEQAVVLSQGQLAAPHVSLALSVSVPEQNKPEFEQLMQLALAVDASANPDTELANTFAQTQARYYLEHTDDLFVE